MAVAEGFRQIAAARAGGLPARLWNRGSGIHHWTALAAGIVATTGSGSWQFADVDTAVRRLLGAELGRCGGSNGVSGVLHRPAGDRETRNDVVRWRGGIKKGP